MLVKAYLVLLPFMFQRQTLSYSTDVTKILPLVLIFPATTSPQDVFITVKDTELHGDATVRCTWTIYQDRMRISGTARKLRNVRGKNVKTIFEKPLVKRDMPDMTVTMNSTLQRFFNSTLLNSSSTAHPGSLTSPAPQQGSSHPMPRQNNTLTPTTLRAEFLTRRISNHTTSTGTIYAETVPNVTMMEYLFNFSLNLFSMITTEITTTTTTTEIPTTTPRIRYFVHLESPTGVTFVRYEVGSGNPKLLVKQSKYSVHRVQPRSPILTLQIRNASCADLGRYSCNLFSSVGNHLTLIKTESDSIKLMDPPRPPKIAQLVPSTPGKVLAGGTLVLECTAYLGIPGDGRLHWSIIKEGISMKISDEDNRVRKKFYDGKGTNESQRCVKWVRETFTSIVTKEDQSLLVNCFVTEKTFRPTVATACRDADRDLCAISRPIEVHYAVNKSAVFVSRVPGSVLKTGSSVTLKCQADAYPRPKFIWRKNKIRMNGTARGDTYILSLKNLKISDSGMYCCEVSNPVFDKTVTVSKGVVIYITERNDYSKISDGNDSNEEVIIVTFGVLTIFVTISIAFCAKRVQKKMEQRKRRTGRNRDNSFRSDTIDDSSSS